MKTAGSRLTKAMAEICDGLQRIMGRTGRKALGESKVYFYAQEDAYGLLRLDDVQMSQFRHLLLARFLSAKPKIFMESSNDESCSEADANSRAPQWVDVGKFHAASHSFQERAPICRLPRALAHCARGTPADVRLGL